MPKKIERIAGLDERLADIAERCGLLPAADVPPRQIRINCHAAPNMIVHGWTVWDWEGKPNRDGRFLRLAIHAVAGLGGTVAKGYVAEMTWCSNNENEADLAKAAEVETVRDVMTVWDWSAMAKSAAKELRWDVAVRLGGES